MVSYDCENGRTNFVTLWLVSGRVQASRRDPRALTDAETVLPAGPHLFLGTCDFLVLDIRDPRRPTITHKIEDRSRIDHINGMVRYRNLIVAANKKGWVDAFDVTKPDAPTLFGALDVRTRDGMRSRWRNV